MSKTYHPALLSLDPSSTAVGWAHMGGPGRLLGAGVIRPMPASQPSYDRILSLCADLRELLNETDPATILIEWTKGKVGRRHTGMGAGLAVYGCGVGSIATECRHWAGEYNNSFCGPNGKLVRPVVVPILENDWTRGVPKGARQLAVAATHNEYRLADDPGGDAADAIGMAEWWYKERNLFSKMA